MNVYMYICIIIRISNTFDLLHLSQKYSLLKIIQNSDVLLSDILR